MTTPKKHILTSYDRLTDELLEEFNLAFPGGYEQYATEVQKANGEKFHAVRMECDDAVYLIRVELRTDKWEDDEEEEEEEGELDEELEEDDKGEIDVADIDESEEEEDDPHDDDDDDDDLDKEGSQQELDDYDV